MKRGFQFISVGLTALLLTAARLSADPSALIAKARAAIGPEDALNGLRSVHYVGNLETVDETPKGPQPVKLGIEIIFQKPYQQRIVMTAPQNIETTALDDYEGWRKQQDPADPRGWQLGLLSKEQIKRLRANSWENLAFFRGIESRGGTVEEQGTAEIDGVKCVKLAFVHEPSIVFTRYFDPTSGKLLLTETSEGGKIREEGKIEAGGIQFPKKIVTTNALGGGKERVVTITFDKVTVNETFPDDLFAVPLLLPEPAAPAKP